MGIETPQTSPEFSREHPVNLKLGSFVPLINGKFVLILNKGSLSEEEGVKYGMIGGTAEILKKSFLKKMFGIKRSKAQKEFDIDIDSPDTVLGLKWLIESKISGLFETDPSREIVEELAQEIIRGYQKKPILTMKEAKEIESSFIGTDSFFEFKRSMNTFYERYYFNGHCSKSIFNKIKKRQKILKGKETSLIYLPTKQELRNGKTDNGIRISKTTIHAFKCLEKMGLINNN